VLAKGKSHYAIQFLFAGSIVRQKPNLHEGLLGVVCVCDLRQAIVGLRYIVQTMDRILIIDHRRPPTISSAKRDMAN
jgi:hypothetical protein